MEEKPKKTQHEPPLILIVDDLDIHLQTVGNTLANNGYDIALASNGKDAVEITNSVFPDLIFLDINMPIMNGYDACKLIKGNPETSDIPIIFLSSNKDIESIVKGLELGAIDFITKPAKQEETLIKVKNHIELKKSKEKIREQNEQLELLLQEKEEFIVFASRDLRNLAKEINQQNELIIKHNLKNFSIFNEINKYARQVHFASISLMDIINDYLILYNNEKGNIKPNITTFNICEVIRKYSEQYEFDAAQKRISIEYLAPEKQILNVKADREKTEIIMRNLLSNAIKYSPFYEKVSVRTKKVSVKNQTYCLIEVEDKGSGLSDEDKTKVFKRFSKLSSIPTNNESKVGLGLSVAKELADCMEGRIWVDSEQGKGSTFKVLLPC